MIELALRAASSEVAAAVSWTGAAVFTALAQIVALFSVIEIGPNLLAFGTSFIGALVLLGQAYLARKVKKIDHVEQRVMKTEAKASTAKVKAEENEARIDELENGA